MMHKRTSPLQSKPLVILVILNFEFVLLFFEQESYVAAQALKRHFLQGITLLFTSAPTIGVQYAEEKRKKVLAQKIRTT